MYELLLNFFEFPECYQVMSEPVGGNFYLNVPLLRSCMNLLFSISLYVSQNFWVMYEPVDGIL